MKAILIDSINKTVTEVEVSKANTLQDWYKLLNCDTVEVACYLNSKEDSILVDEEFMLKPMAPTDPWFYYEGAPQPYGGNGLITGVNSKGDSIAPRGVTVEEVRSKVRFMTLADVRRNYATG
jgi:hypothetical protein